MTSEQLKIGVKKSPGHPGKFLEQLERSYVLAWLINRSSRSTPEHQKCCTYHATKSIRHEVIQSGMTAGQIDLMPFIQNTYQQRTGKRCDYHARTLQSAGMSNSEGKNGEGNSMKKFIPWRGNQIYSNRLRSQKKQIEYHYQNKHCRCDAQVVR